MTIYPAYANKFRFVDQNVETDVAINIDIRMEAGSLKLDFGRLESRAKEYVVVLRKCRYTRISTHLEGIKTLSLLSNDHHHQNNNASSCNHHHYHVAIAGVRSGQQPKSNATDNNNNNNNNNNKSSRRLLSIPSSILVFLCLVVLLS
ncbi:hypothetical protein ACFE04_005555 [Oxalis oulophora]